jgi:hypothetical protein
MLWRLLLVLLAVIALTSCVTCAKDIREGVAMTMGACYAKCDMLERPDCIKGVICDGASQTTQECKHYCGIKTNTHPNAIHHTTPQSPPLAHQQNSNWPILYGPHGKVEKSAYLPPNSTLLVPSVNELMEMNGRN